jgi:xylitol oxidase
MGFTPSKGDELQAEYLVGREHTAAVVNALRALELPHLLVSELRTIAADTLWMSPTGGRETLAVHFTFERADITAELHDVEAALAPFDPRPHPGKCHLMPLRRSEAFEGLAARLDPRGAFRP